MKNVKRCPFCGSLPEVSASTKFHRVKCQCGAEIMVHFYSVYSCRDDARDLWNRRVDSDEPELAPCPCGCESVTLDTFHVQGELMRTITCNSPDCPWIFKGSSEGRLYAIKAWNDRGKA